MGDNVFLLYGACAIHASKITAIESPPFRGLPEHRPARDGHSGIPKGEGGP
jgi:hypothetical protein